MNYLLKNIHNAAVIVIDNKTHQVITYIDPAIFTIVPMGTGKWAAAIVT
jgi:hypothetical protein